MRRIFTATSAAALLLLSGAAQAQQQKDQPGGGAGAAQGGAAHERGSGGGAGEKGGPAAPGGKADRPQPRAEGGLSKGATPTAEKGQAQHAEPRGKADARSKAANDQAEKGRQHAEPKDKSGPGPKGAAAKPNKEDNQRAETLEKSDGATKKATAPNERDRNQRQAEPKDQRNDTTKGAAAERNGNNRQADTKNASGGDRSRVQLSQEQRTNLHKTFLRQSNVNRVRNVNIRVEVGTRVPRTVRLAPIPAAVLTIVPQYRGYDYFLVEDDVCIVEPRTHAIVDVIVIDGRDRPGHQTASLVLSDQDRRIILDHVEFRGAATLGIGALEVGAPVPRGVRLEPMPVVVIERVPQLRGFHYFTAEDAVAIVDRDESRISLVIEQRR